MSPPSLSPQPQEDGGGQIQFSHDNHFALHGLITLVIFVGVFFLFIVFILTIPCFKRSSATSSSEAADQGHEEDEDPNVAERRTASTTTTTQHRDEEDNLRQTQTQTGLISNTNSSGEVISRKFPL